jgi:hypothetical protein
MASVVFFLTILTPPFCMLSTKHQFNISLPTFVPSIATGLTATSTSFKSPPKDSNELFDFAIAGPLVGMIFSLVALAVGMNWTLYSDASFLPALPLTFLRQSSLAGGIIESVLGAGALYVPAGADIASVASINISMHPLAITGFVGMLINALALIPYGCKKKIHVFVHSIIVPLKGKAFSQLTHILYRHCLLFFCQQRMVVWWESHYLADPRFGL